MSKNEENTKTPKQENDEAQQKALKAKAASKKEKKNPEYVIAKGKSISTLVGNLTEGMEFKEEFLKSEKSIEKLLKLKAIEKYSEK